MWKVIELPVTPYVGVWIETFFAKNNRNNNTVTPYVGVWIETVVLHSIKLWKAVTPYVGVWIETITYRLSTGTAASHSLCGSVDWNRSSRSYFRYNMSHSLCGSVDWNPKFSADIYGNVVTPYVGVWIETRRLMVRPLLRPSHSLCGSVDWNNFYDLTNNNNKGSCFLYGRCCLLYTSPSPRD